MNVNGLVRDGEREAIDIETGQHGSNLSVRSAKIARILSRTSERREEKMTSFDKGTVVAA